MHSLPIPAASNAAIRSRTTRESTAQNAFVSTFSSGPSPSARARPHNSSSAGQSPNGSPPLKCTRQPCGDAEISPSHSANACSIPILAIPAALRRARQIARCTLRVAPIGQHQPRKGPVFHRHRFVSPPFRHAVIVPKHARQVTGNRRQDTPGTFGRTPGALAARRARLAARRARLAARPGAFGRTPGRVWPHGRASVRPFCDRRQASGRALGHAATSLATGFHTKTPAKTPLSRSLPPRLAMETRAKNASPRHKTACSRHKNTPNPTFGQSKNR